MPKAAVGKMKVMIITPVVNHTTTCITTEVLLLLYWCLLGKQGFFTVGFTLLRAEEMRAC